MQINLIYTTDYVHYGYNSMYTTIFIDSGTLGLKQGLALLPYKLYLLGFYIAILISIYASDNM